MQKIVVKHNTVEIWTCLKYSIKLKEEEVLAKQLFWAVLPGALHQVLTPKPLASGSVEFPSSYT